MPSLSRPTRSSRSSSKPQGPYCTKANWTDGPARSDKAMRQCFPPDWDEQYPDLIPGLREMVVATYKEGIPVRIPVLRVLRQSH